MQFLITSYTNYYFSLLHFFVDLLFLKKDKKVYGLI